MDFIPVCEPNLSGREREYVLDCIDSGWISSRGKYVPLFEDAVAKAAGTRHAVAVCNGTVALHLALVTLGIGPGDEVVVPSLTFIATANAVAYTGARPVFVDSDPRTWNLDPSKLEATITPRTRAIIPVHLYGHPCDMDAIFDIARPRGIPVIEDAAEAIGSRYKGKPAGSVGAMAVFSFFGNKTVTTGEGGALVTDDARLADRARLLKGQGMSLTRYYFFETLGYNYRMTNIQAALGLAQMEKLDFYLGRKREMASQYTSLLSRARGLTLPVEEPYAFNSYWLYSILVGKMFGKSRDGLMEHLKERGIETRRFFYPCHAMPAFQGLSKGLPVAERLSEEGLSLPSSTKLTALQVEYIARAILEAAA